MAGRDPGTGKRLVKPKLAMHPRAMLPGHVLLQALQQARLPYAGDVHAELAAVALLAGSNADVDKLNGAARVLRRAAGEITGPEVRYRQPGGRTLALAVGDHVRIHTNDYRARRGQGANVLNGYRGRVMAFDAQRRVLVEWRAPHPDGPRLEREWITPGYIAAGGLSHGTAMTVAATQGATVDRALVYGQGLDPHSLYAAMSRDREAVRLYLPRELLETDADRARLGEPDSYAVELQRALAAYAATLQGDRADRLVTAEPEPIVHQRAAERERAGRPSDPRAVEQLLERHRGHDRVGDPGREGAERDAERDAGGRQGDAEHATQTAGAAERPVDAEVERARRELQDAEREARAAVERASALLCLTQLPLGVGLLTDAQLQARVRPLAERVAAAAAQVEAAEQHARRYARDGGGPAERALEETRARLAEQLAQIEDAERAATRLQQARQTVIDGRKQIRLLQQRETDIQRELAGLGRLRSAHRARRRELEAALPRVLQDLAAARERLAPALHEGPALQTAAEQAATAAPPPTTWPLIRSRHRQLDHDLDAARRGARARDVDDATQRADQARHDHHLAQDELAAVHDERRRRAGLPPARREIERAARAQHTQRKRAAAARGDSPLRPAPGLQRDREHMLSASSWSMRSGSTCVAAAINGTSPLTVEMCCPYSGPIPTCGASATGSSGRSSRHSAAHQLPVPSSHPHTLRPCQPSKKNPNGPGYLIPFSSFTR